MSVLVVEDEPAYAEALAAGLSQEGFEIAVAATGEEAIRRFAERRPDLVLLDLVLPGMSGLDVCRWVRNHSSVPVIVVTARTDEMDTVVALEVGADDYVTKPFRLRELAARMRAALRRTPVIQGGAPALETIVVGRVALDAQRHAVHLDGEPVDLSLKEFQLLEVLLANAGRVLTRGTLLERVWGIDVPSNPKTLDVHIGRLRAKLGDDASSPSLIETVRGIGYRFRPAEPSTTPPT